MKSKNSDDRWLQRAKLEFLDGVLGRMEELGVSRSDLARRLDCGRGFITKLLSGEHAPTLRTMVKVSRALEFDSQPALVEEIPTARLYREAMHTFSAETQMLVALEEMGELIQALCKWQRFGCDREYRPAVIEEIADVEIMVSQLKALLGEHEVDEKVTEKLLRLRRRIKAEKEARDGQDIET